MRQEEIVWHLGPYPTLNMTCVFIQSVNYFFEYEQKASLKSLNLIINIFFGDNPIHSQVFHAKIKFTFQVGITWLRDFKKFQQKTKLPPVGIESTTLISTGLEVCRLCHPRHVLLGRSLTEVCFMHHFTFWISIISKIIRAWLYESV